eukprot:1082527-Pleurochrysis_carterae.AAC.10
MQGKRVPAKRTAWGSPLTLLRISICDWLHANEGPRKNRTASGAGYSRMGGTVPAAKVFKMALICYLVISSGILVSRLVRGCSSRWDEFRTFTNLMARGVCCHKRLCAT